MWDMDLLIDFLDVGQRIYVYSEVPDDPPVATPIEPSILL
jgi:hypothetical protein